MFAKSLAGAADDEAIMEIREKVVSQLRKHIFPLKRRTTTTPVPRGYT